MVFCSKNGSKRGFSEKKYGTNRVFGGVKYSKRSILIHLITSGTSNYIDTCKAKSFVGKYY